MLINIEPYDRHRPRNTFECGRKPIDSWYKNHAKKCVDRAEYRVFEAVVDGTPHAIGYYALQIGNESMNALATKPDDYTKNYTAFPAVHLAFLGVHRSFQRKGVGSVILSDVFDKVAAISDLAGMYALTLQSLDTQSTAFYTNLGFTPYSGHRTAPKMLIPIRTILTLVREP